VLINSTRASQIREGMFFLGESKVINSYRVPEVAKFRALGALPAVVLWSTLINGNLKHRGS
jgi:hypothetical protein